MVLMPPQSAKTPTAPPQTGEPRPYAIAPLSGERNMRVDESNSSAQRKCPLRQRRHPTRACNGSGVQLVFGRLGAGFPPSQLGPERLVLFDERRLALLR